MLSITSEEELSSLLSNSTVPVLLDFWASWCGPCKRIAPFFESLATRFRVQLAKVDVDTGKALAEKFGVSAMPTFVLLNRQGKLDEMKGASATNLEAMVSKWCTPL